MLYLPVLATESCRLGQVCERTNVVVSLGIHHYELRTIEDNRCSLSKFGGLVAVSAISKRGRISYLYLEVGGCLFWCISAFL